MRDLLKTLQAAVDQIQDHIGGCDDSSGSDEYDCTALLGLLRSVHDAAEKMEAAVRARSLSPPSEVMQQAAQDVQFFRASQDAVMEKVAAAPVRKRSRNCRSVYGSQNMQREALLEQFGSEEDGSNGSDEDLPRGRQQRRRQTMGRPALSAVQPTPQAQRPKEEPLLGDTPMAAIALAEMGGRGVTGSPQRPARVGRGVTEDEVYAMPPKRRRDGGTHLKPAPLMLLSDPIPEGDDADYNDNSQPFSGTKHCNCKKSRCLKLYCECFSAGRFCDTCACRNCQNTECNSEQVSAVRRQILARSPNAFAVKVLKGEGHRKGCRCRKSKCLKKYCECFQANVRCSDACRCDECHNTGPGNPKDGELPRAAAHVGQLLRARQHLQCLQETPRSHLKQSALPILPLFSLAGAEDTGEDGSGKGPPPASTARAALEALPLPSSALTAQTTPEEQSARTGHEFGSPDGNSQQQGESSARLSPVRLGGSPMAAGSPARLQAMAQVAQQQLRCSQRAQPRPELVKQEAGGVVRAISLQRARLLQAAMASTAACPPVSGGHSDSRLAPAEGGAAGQLQQAGCAPLGARRASDTQDDAMSPPTAELQQAGQETPTQGWKAGGETGAGVPQRHPSPLRMARLDSPDAMRLPPGGLWISPSHASDSQLKGGPSAAAGNQPQSSSGTSQQQRSSSDGGGEGHLFRLGHPSTIAA